MSVTPIEDFTYIRSRDVYTNEYYITIQTYTGTDENVYIPEEINGEKVRSFEINGKFTSNQSESALNIKNIYISKYINYIPERYFINSQNLENIFVDEENTTFRDTDGILFTIHDQNTNNLKLYPYGKKDKIYYISENVRQIMTGAFENNSFLEELHFPKTVVNLSTGAISQCENIKVFELSTATNCMNNSIYLNNNVLETCILTEGNVHYSMSYAPWNITPQYQNFNFILEEGITILKTGTITSQVKTEELFLPESLLTIETEAINSNSIKTIYFGEKLQNITYKIDRPPTNAIYSSALETISINPNNQNFIIEDNILYNINKTQIYLYCTKDTRESLTISNNITILSPVIFKNVINLKTVIIENENISLNNAFSECRSLKNITIPASAKIGRVEFNSCTLERVHITKGTGVMPDYHQQYTPYTYHTPWYNNGEELQEFIIDGGITSIGKYAFYNCVNINDNNILSFQTVKYLNDYCFANCLNLKNIILPNNIEKISEGVFSNCTSLEEILISDSVITIEDSIFAYCNKLKKITLGENLTSITGLFYLCNSTLIKTITIPEKVNYLGQNCFPAQFKIDEIIFLTDELTVDRYNTGIQNSEVIKGHLPILTSLEVQNIIPKNFTLINTKADESIIVQEGDLITGIKALIFPFGLKLGNEENLQIGIATRVNNDSDYTDVTKLNGEPEHEDLLKLSNASTFSNLRRARAITPVNIPSTKNFSILNFKKDLIENSTLFNIAITNIPENHAYIHIRAYVQKNNQEKQVYYTDVLTYPLIENKEA